MRISTSRTGQILIHPAPVGRTQIQHQRSSVLACLIQNALTISGPASAHISGEARIGGAEQPLEYRLRIDLRLPACRVSQDPRLIYSCALSPTTPEGPASACSLLPRRCQASSSLADWPPPLSVTRPNRVRLRYGSQVCFPGFHQTDRSAPLRFSYMYERAIYMVNSFQFTRSARLSLVFQSRQDAKKPSWLP